MANLIGVHVTVNFTDGDTTEQLTKRVDKDGLMEVINGHIFNFCDPEVSSIILTLSKTKL